MERLKRLFLAVPVAEETKAMLAQHLGPRLLPGRPIPPDNWHLTIRFLGGTDEVARERLMAELDQADLGSAFEISLGEMGAFPRPRKATVLWLAVERGFERLAALNEIAEEVAQAAGFEAEERPFSVHLTLSRIRPDQDVRPVVAAYNPVPIRWTARELVLYQSHVNRGGAVYERLESFDLS